MIDKEWQMWHAWDVPMKYVTADYNVAVTLCSTYCTSATVVDGVVVASAALQQHIFTIYSFYSIF